MYIPPSIPSISPPYLLRLRPREGLSEAGKERGREDVSLLSKEDHGDGEILTMKNLSKKKDARLTIWL